MCRPPHYTAGIYLLGLLFLALSSPASEPASSGVVQLHVVSAHVRDRASFNQLFHFLGETLEMPLLYGALCDPAKTGGREYAGFGVGNAYLEPCGPYQGESGYTDESPARWHGLTFLIEGGLARIVDRLNGLGLEHSGIVVDRFVYLKDPRLTSPRLALSFWECREPGPDVGLDKIRKRMLETKGAGLGLITLKSLTLNIPSPEARTRWRQILGCQASPEERLSVGQGPAIDFNSVPEASVQVLNFEVRDLLQTRRFLESKGLHPIVDAGALELPLAEALGLRFHFIQQAQH